MGAAFGLAPPGWHGRWLGVVEAGVEEPAVGAGPFQGGVGVHANGPVGVGF